MSINFEIVMERRRVLMLLLFLFIANTGKGQDSKTLIDSGWAEMLIDNDSMKHINQLNLKRIPRMLGCLYCIWESVLIVQVLLKEWIIVSGQ